MKSCRIITKTTIWKWYKHCQTQEMKLYLSMRQNEAADMCRKTSTLMVPLFVEQLLFLCTISPDFCFLNLTSKIFIATRVDYSLCPLGYLLPVPCIHLKSLILSCCDPSVITCLGGPNVLDIEDCEIALSPEPSGYATFPKSRVPLCPTLW